MYGKGEIVEIGKKIYAEAIAPQLTEADRGKMVYVNIKTGDYIMEDDEIEGFNKTRELYPDDLFYLHRVGYKTAHTFGGKMSRTETL